MNICDIFLYRVMKLYIVASNLNRLDEAILIDDTIYSLISLLSGAMEYDERQN